MMTSLPRTLLVILTAGLLLRIFLFGIVLYTQGGEAFFVSDSAGFLQSAQNLLAGNGFSRSAGPPFLPSAHFPPVYPLLLAGSLKLASSAIPLIILQIILGTLLPLLVWKIGKIFTDKTSVCSLAAGLMALEPVTGIFNLLVITDTVAVFSLILAVLFFLHIFQKNYRTCDAALAGLFLGLSTLTKPNAQFLFILGLLALISVIFLKNWKGGIKTAFFFALAFLIVLSPWLIRNTIQFGSPSVSATGLRNLYTDFAVSVLSYEAGRPYGEVEEVLKTSFSERHGISLAEISSDPSLGGALAREGLEIMFAHPHATLSVLTITLQTFFTQDLYTYFAQKFHLIQPMTFDFSPSLVLFKEGPLVLAARVWELLGIRSVIPLVGRLIWILLTAFAAGGIWAAMRNGGRERIVAIVMTAIILYYAATSAVAAFSDQGRHRYPADAFIFLLASYGALRLLKPWSEIPTINKTSPTRQ